jgi:hypothetical protein
MPEARVPHAWRVRVATIRRLSWPDRWLLVESGLLLVGLGVSLQFWNVQTVHAFLRRFLREPRSAGAPRLLDPRRVGEFARVVQTASRHAPVTTTCLHRALGLWWLLSRRGYDSHLRFGVRRLDGRFEAHAWVEHGGSVVADAEAADGAFVELSLTPPARDP